MQSCFINSTKKHMNTTKPLAGLLRALIGKYIYIWVSLVLLRSRREPENLLCPLLSSINGLLIASNYKEPEKGK